MNKNSDNQGHSQEPSVVVDDIQGLLRQLSGQKQEMAAAEPGLSAPAIDEDWEASARERARTFQEELKKRDRPKSRRIWQFVLVIGLILLFFLAIGFFTFNWLQSKVNQDKAEISALAAQEIDQLRKSNEDTFSDLNRRLAAQEQQFEEITEKIAELESRLESVSEARHQELNDKLAAMDEQMLELKKSLAILMELRE
ncbi:MAG: hypothetical protein FWF85_05335 [Clostridiales bacterium]|nr:hypothetical protein [Clostridiales bacterium]MDR2711560.1 hypothetical protein [Clostridiales bacterium]